MSDINDNSAAPQVVGLGEVLWDVLPEGRKLGGAPANFAYHAAALGARGIPVSRVGKDALGDETLDQLSEHGLDTAHVSVDPVHPTGTVAAMTDAEGCASYTFPPDVAWDFLDPGPDTLALAGQAEAVCFGTLAQRSPVSRAGIRRFLDAVSPDCLKMLDINLRGDFHDRELIENSLNHADLLKLSDEELPVLREHFTLPDDAPGALHILLRSFDLRLIALTRGDKGSMLVTPDSVHDHPGLAVEVRDTIGAGDAFTAAVVLGLLRGLAPAEINERAAETAATVCSRTGGMPPLPDSLRIF